VTGLPDAYLDLLDGPHTAVLVTLLPDGSPHGSPVWFVRDGDAVLVSTRKGLQKYRDVVRDPRVALTVVDPAKPLRYVEVRGTVTVDDDPTCATRDAVARKHGFPDGAAFDGPDPRRVTFRITPTRVVGR
jgi:PPOX class probable F420-dependent enzyme